MKTSTLVAVVLILGGLAATWWPAGFSPAPIPEPPDAATRALVAPVA